MGVPSITGRPGSGPPVFVPEGGDRPLPDAGLPSVVGGHVGGGPPPGLLHGDEGGPTAGHGHGGPDPEAVAGGPEPHVGGALADRVRDRARLHGPARLN